MASVLDQLASALDRNDERPNVELAQRLIERPDPASLKELIGALSTGTTAVQNDAIKVLYEVAERRPELFGPGDIPPFLATLKSRNNRMVWGGMSALAAMTVTQHKAMARQLPEILAAADKGSVIARDKAMSMLATLAGKVHGATAVPLLLDRIETAAPNQFPMYAEFAATAVDAAHRPRLVAIIETRLPKVAGDAKRRRLEKLLRKLAK